MSLWVEALSVSPLRNLATNSGKVECRRISRNFVGVTDELFH